MPLKVTGVVVIADFEKSYLLLYVLEIVANKLKTAICIYCFALKEGSFRHVEAMVERGSLPVDALTSIQPETALGSSP